jgi:hypothetical protein
MMAKKEIKASTARSGCTQPEHTQCMIVRKALPFLAQSCEMQRPRLSWQHKNGRTRSAEQPLRAWQSMRLHRYHSPCGAAACFQCPIPWSRTCQAAVSLRNTAGATFVRLQAVPFRKPWWVPTARALTLTLTLTLVGAHCPGPTVCPGSTAELKSHIQCPDEVASLRQQQVGEPWRSLQRPLHLHCQCSY